MSRKTPPAKVERAIQSAAAELPVSVIARETELSEGTVRQLLRRHSARVNVLRDLKRDELLANWQFLYLDTVDALDAARGDGTLTLRDRQAAAITMGIATEKALLLSGQPTQILAGIHEHRTSIPALLSKLQEVTHRIGPHCH